MAKRLGFKPDSLIRATPNPKQKWKLSVKYRIHELHFKRFGHVIGEMQTGCANLNSWRQLLVHRRI
jgi:hypothetical protein